MKLDRLELAAVFAGGAVGAMARAGVGEILASGGPGWPWATFLVNIVGAFALGVFVTGLPVASYARPLLASGFCGALTTFSTMQVELVRMLEDGRGGLAVAYATASVVLGLAAVALATSLVRRTGRAV